MKKGALLLAILLGVVVAATAAESSLYVKTLYIEKVYQHELGYKIEYRRTNAIYLAVAYFPLEWFSGAGRKAQLIYTRDRSVPYVNIYWEDGQFSHLRLYVHPSFEHMSWGTLRGEEGLEAKFDLEEPQLLF